MWSINSARALGVSIGKAYPNVSVSDDLLLQVVDAQLLPLIKLPKSRDRRLAEEVAGLFGLLLILSLVGTYAVIDITIPGLLIPDSANRWILPVWVASAALIVSTLLTGYAWSRTAAIARSKLLADTNALRQAAFKGAFEALDRRRAHAGIPLKRNLDRGTRGPHRIPGGVTPRGAEELVAQWMRHLGEFSAAVTQYQGDGGIDVAGSRFVAQVKHHAVNVGVAPIREIAGTATYDGRGALFFTSTGYSRGAIEFANRAHVALFVYSAERAELRALNPLAVALLERGLT